MTTTVTSSETIALLEEASALDDPAIPKQRTMVVTGASRGIGLATAEKLSGTDTR